MISYPLLPLEIKPRIGAKVPYFPRPRLATTKERCETALALYRLKVPVLLIYEQKGAYQACGPTANKNVGVHYESLARSV